MRRHYRMVGSVSICEQCPLLSNYLITVNCLQRHVVFYKASKFTVIMRSFCSNEVLQKLNVPYWVFFFLSLKVGSCRPLRAHWRRNTRRSWERHLASASTISSPSSTCPSRDSMTSSIGGEFNKFQVINIIWSLGRSTRTGGHGKIYTRAPGNFAPKMQKRALKNKKRLQCKSLFNVADLVIGMWKVAPEEKKKLVCRWGGAHQYAYLICANYGGSHCLVVMAVRVLSLLCCASNVNKYLLLTHVWQLALALEHWL